MMNALVSGCITFVAAVGLTWAVRNLARARGWIATPRTDRWHGKPTALFGGVAIFGAFLLGVLANVTFFGMAWNLEVGWLLGGGVAVFLLGLIDDCVPLRPITKIVFELMAASAVITGLGWLLPVSTMFLVNTLLTYFWFIGIINALNMLDNMDGLTAGIGFIAAVSMATVLVMIGQGDSAQVYLLAVLAGALGGYLIFNFKPASIFMGDGGSLFVGYLTAALAVATANAASRTPTWFGDALEGLLPLALLAALLAVPIFDTSFVTLSRKWHGRAAMEGGRDHTSHRLVLLGLSERGAVFSLYGLGLIGGGLAIALAVQPHTAIVAISFFGLFLMLLGVRLGSIPVYPHAQVRSPLRVQVMRFLENIFIRRYAGAVATDIILIGGSYYTAFIFRYEDQFAGAAVALYVRTLPIVIPVLLLWFLSAGIYGTVWRVISIFDVKRYVVTFAIVPLLLVASYTALGYRFSVSLVLIFTLLLAALMISCRLFFRLLEQSVNKARDGTGSEGHRVLIYGAGHACRIAIEELLRDPRGRFHIVGLLDDDPKLWGRKIWGFQVLGGGPGVVDAVLANDVDQVIVCSQKIDAWSVANRLKPLPEPPVVSRMTVAFQLVGTARPSFTP